MRSRFPVILFAVALMTLVAGCATRPVPRAEPPATAGTTAQRILLSAGVGPALEERILALDPDHITGDDVVGTLAQAPAPQIVLLHGGIFPTHLIMASAGRFLAGMGYPEARIRDPGDRRWSHSPYEDSAHIAGLIAWYYERDGMRPMMIGHSQGGIQAIKVLYELAGRFADDPIPVWDPYTDEALDRTTIVDPLTGAERPVIGLTVCYASVVAAGGAALLLPNQWSMAGKLHTIPDAVDDFTGFSIGLDLVAWTLPGVNGSTEFRRDGAARVRSVALPAVYNHLTVPIVGPLVDDKETRDWINAYVPGETTTDPPPQTVGYGVLWAADVWYSVKKHWALEAQRLIRASRAAPGQP